MGEAEDPGGEDTGIMTHNGDRRHDVPAAGFSWSAFRMELLGVHRRVQRNAVKLIFACPAVGASMEVTLFPMIDFETLQEGAMHTIRHLPRYKFMYREPRSGAVSTRLPPLKRLHWSSSGPQRGLRVRAQYHLARHRGTSFLTDLS